MSSNNNYKDNNKYEMPPELLENAKDVIIDYVKNGYPNGTTFAELENELTEKGLVVLNKNKRPENGEPCATALDMPSNDKISNVVIWNTKNDLLAEACTSLLNEKD